MSALPPDYDVVDYGTAYDSIANPTQLQLTEYTMGPRGLTGPPGLAGASYIHEQAMPAVTWIITHGLNRYPSVTVADSAGTVVVGGCRYNSANQITLTFAAMFSGKAYLN